jgi:IS605 OrfB family transposase
MNEKEGSADDILAITKIEQFIDLVLTPLIDPNMAKSLPKVIEQHKEKLKKVPILTNEKALVETLRNHFIALQEPANEYLSLQERKNENAIARQQIAARVIKTDISIRNAQNKFRIDLNNLKDEQTRNQQQITKVSAGIQWLESEKLRLIYAKETATHQSAIKVLNAQKRQYDLHLAAQYLEKLRQIENRCTTLQNEIEQANAPVAEIAAHLHTIGLVYHGIVDNKAKLQSKLKKGVFNSHQIRRLTEKRNNQADTYLHVASRTVVDWLVANNIGTLIIGKNSQWKSGINIGKRNNQNFVQIPHTRLIELIQYKFEQENGIVVVNEESYTSKASALDLDEIPTFSKRKNQKTEFSGKRVKRGLYKTLQGLLINADLNGALNIIRKVAKNSLDDLVSDKQFIHHCATPKFFLDVAYQ